MTWYCNLPSVTVFLPSFMHTYSSAFSYLLFLLSTYPPLSPLSPPHTHTPILGVSFAATEVATEQTPLASDEVCMWGGGLWSTVYMLVTFPLPLSLLLSPFLLSPFDLSSFPPSLSFLSSLHLPPPSLSPPSLSLPSLPSLPPTLPQSVENKVTAILPMFRVSACARPTLGSRTAVQDGIYEIIWDNTYSRWESSYNIYWLGSSIIYECFK